MKREATFTGDRNYAIRVCSDDEAEAWDEALRQEGVERERARILAAQEAEYAAMPETNADDEGAWCLPLTTIRAAIKGEE